MKNLVRVLVSLLFSAPLMASNLPYHHDYLKEVNKKFFVNNKLSNVLLDQFKGELSKRRTELLDLIYREELLLNNRSEDRARKKALKDGAIQNYDLLLNLIDGIDQNSPLKELYEQLKMILEIDLALKSEIDPENDPRQMMRHIGTFLSQFKIHKRKISSYGEASNLINPANGEFFSSKELEKMKKKGVDISKFDPPADNGVIFPMGDISTVDVNDVYHHAKDRLHGDLKTEWPAGNVAFFDKIRKTQSKPKIFIYTKNKQGKKKRKYKLKLGIEIHSEPTSAALSATLGMPVDISRHVKSFKMILGKMTFDELKLEWNEYYGSYKLEDYIKEIGSDSEGNYITFKEGMLEAKYDDADLNRVGPWYWGEIDHKGRREFRGLLLYNIWIHNTDLKEAENNKLVYRNINGKRQLYYLQHDLGFGFGHYFRERPKDFRWNIVEHNTKKKITFDFRSFQPNSGFKHVTFSDAKWMVRKIAQLTRKQISDAVRLGHWPNSSPYNYEGLLVEKLIHRRNELVEVFDLVGERLPSGKEITLLPVDRSIEDDVEYAPSDGIPGETSDFRSEILGRVVSPLMEGIENLSFDTLISGVGAISRVPIDPGWVGLDDGLISQIIVKLKRSITENPDPKSLEESYIVRDDYEIGFRLGAGFIVSGDVSYVKKFSLVFTTETKAQARKHKRYVFKIAKPYRELISILPKKHVLINEHYLEGRGRVRVDGGLISLGVEGTLSRIGLTRNIIANNGGSEFTLYEDKSAYNQAGFRFYTRLAIMKIPHFEMNGKNGDVERTIYHVDLKNLPPQKRSLDLVIRNNDFSEIKKYAEIKKIKNNFVEKYLGLSFFGLRSYKRRYRLDDMKILISDGDKFTEMEQHLDANLKKTGRWWFLGNGEEHSRRIRISTEYKNDKMIKPFIEINFSQRDENVTANELKNGYLKFINGVAGRNDFIAFSPEDHSIMETWGPLNVHVKIQYFKKGIENLLKSKRLTYLKVLAKLLNLSYGDLNYYMSTVERDPSQRDMRVRYLGKAYSLKAIAKRFNSFMDRLNFALSLPKLKKKLSELTYALDKILFKKGHSYSPILLNMVNKVVGEDNLYLNSRIVVPREWENKLPARIKPYNEMGRERSFSNREALFFGIQDAYEIYHLFLRGRIPEILN